MNCLYCGNKLVKTQKKYCNTKCQRSYEAKVWTDKWLNGEIDGFSETDHWGNIPDRIRNYLFKINENKCARCGWGEMNPYTKRIPLEVEHIDGNHKNNRPENLTLLCPNCHSLTKSYRGANRGNGRKKTWIPADYSK